MAGQSGLSSFLPLIVMIAAAWFLLIRPQQKRAKDQAALLASLRVGSQVVSIGGIFGTIVEDHDERLLIEVADGSRLELARRAVGSVVSSPDVEELPETDVSPDAADKDAADDTIGDNS